MRNLGGSRLGRVAVSCALVAISCGLSASAITAQVLDESRELRLSRLLFEQARARQLAHGGGPVPISLDAYGLSVKLVDAKTLLDRASGKAETQPAISEADRLMERTIALAYQSLLANGISCCPCSSAATCSDGLFCNGGEGCIEAYCYSGSAPCVDNNPCTIDSCVENTDSCSFQQVPPPAEVAQLAVGRSAPASSVATLAWSTVAGASAYNVYRGASSNLFGLACFQSGVTATTQNDDGALPGGAFYFLVTSLACGESGLGSGRPNLRPPPPGCP